MNPASKKILHILEPVKKFMGNDNGGLEIVNCDENMIKIRIIGKCANCMVRKDLLIETIEQKIKCIYPEIKRIIIV